MARFQIFVLLFSLVLISSVHSSHQQLPADVNDDKQSDEVNQAFKQMSKYCFEDVDCQKCADSFHESATDVQATIFGKMSSENSFTKMVEDTVSSMSSSFKDRILESCKALMKAKAKMTKPDDSAAVLFTNYSGTSSNQGVFLATLYSMIPQAEELNDKDAASPQFLAALPDHPISNSKSPTSDPSAQYMDPKAWGEYVPKQYQDFSKMGQTYQDQQKKFSEKYTGKSNSHSSSSSAQPKAMVLVSLQPVPSPASSDSSPLQSMEQYFKAVPVIGQFNLTEMEQQFPSMDNIDLNNITQLLPSYKFDGFSYTTYNLSSIPGMNSFPGMNPEMIQKFSDLNRMHMPNASDYVPSSFNMSNIESIIPFQLPNVTGTISSIHMPMMPLHMPNTTNGIPSLPVPEFFHLPNMSNVFPSMDSIDSLGDYDIGKLGQYRNTLPDIENMNLTDMASPSVGFLFIDTDGNQLVAFPMMDSSDKSNDQGVLNFNQYSKTFDPMYKKGHEMDQKVMNKIDEMMPDSLSQLQQSVSDASHSIGQRLKDATSGSINDIKTAGREVLHTIKSAYPQQPDAPFQASTQIVQLPNKKFATASPMSFYVETTDGKISYLEQIPMASTSAADDDQKNAIQSMMSNAKNQAQSALHSLHNVIEGYWNKFASGSCLDMAQFVSTKFEGMIDQFDFDKFLQPAQQFASNGLKDVNQMGQSFGIDKYTKSAQEFMGQGTQGFSKQGSKTQDFVKSYIPHPVQDIQRKSQFPGNAPLGSLVTFFGFQGPHIPPPTPAVAATNDEPQSMLGRMIHGGVELQKQESGGFGNPLGQFGVQPQFSGFQYDPMMQSIMKPSGQGSMMLLESKNNDLMTSSQPHSALMKACEYAKENSLFDDLNVPYVHELFFNPKSRHGVASISFTKSQNGNSEASPVAFLDITSTNDDNDGAFDEIYRNLTEIVQTAVNNKMEKAQKAFNDLKSAAEEKIGKLQQDAKSTIDDQQTKKDQLMNDFTDYVSKKLDEYKNQMNDAVDQIHEQLTEKLEKVKKCKQGDSDCVVNAISLYQIPAGDQKQLVTFFKSTPDGKKIMKMVNFKAVKHDDSKLLSRLETNLFPGAANAAVSTAALAIYASVAVAMFLAWVWARLSAKPEGFMAYIDDAESPLTSGGPLITNDQSSNANYYRMQDV